MHKRLRLYSTQWGAWITPSWEQEANAKSVKRSCRAGVWSRNLRSAWSERLQWEKSRTPLAIRGAHWGKKIT